MKLILPSVRGARRIFHNGVRQVNCNGGRDFRVPSDGGRKGGAGARLSQPLREGNRRGSAAIYRERRPKFPQCFRARRVLAIAASFRSDALAKTLADPLAKLSPQRQRTTRRDRSTLADLARL